MSPERPPSQNSVGGSGNVIEPTNMVLSTIPIESGHVVIHHHHHQPATAQQLTNGGGSNTYTQIIRNGTQNLISTVSSPQLTTKSVSVASANVTASPSKYVVIHQNGNGQYRTSDGTTYLTTQPNGTGGNIVFLSTEPMDVSHGEQNLIVSTNGTTTDEDLTSLTWLQDKDLLKDLVVRTNGKTTVASPIRQSNGVGIIAAATGNGPLSPTSDFLEDSSVSEDNLSSVNSSSDQGISISGVEYSPTIGTNATTTFTTYQPGQYHTITTPNHQQITSGGHHFVNNNTLTKNRNHIMSPTKPTVTATLTPAAIVPDSNATKTVMYNGPSGTTTVVEYKAGTNFSPPPVRHIHATNNPAILSPQRSPPPSINSITISSSTVASPTSSSSSLSSLSSTTSSASSTARHQHFHKKYIREQLNSGSGGSGFNGNNNAPSSERNGTSNSLEYSAVQHPANPQPVQNFYASNIHEPEDFHHRTPIKTETVSYDSIGHEEVYNTRESLNFDSPNVGSCRTSLTTQKAVNTTSTSSSIASSATASPKQKHPTNVPYDPLVHTTNKPPYSFSSLIFMAIEDSPEKALPVKEIYAWIVQHFPYFKTAPTGWKNSVRHNLSLNKSFLKVEKAPNMGKGSLWRVEDQQRQNLLQALARSPFHQCSAVDKFSPYKQQTTSAAPSRTMSESPPETPVKSNLDPELFPKLWKTMKDMKKGANGNCGEDDQDEQQQHYPVNGSCLNGNVNGAGRNYCSNGKETTAMTATGNGILQDYSIERLARDCGADSIDDVHAATAMLALKHGPNIFGEHFQNGSPVITSSPSEDHTYSAGGVGSSGNGSAGGGGGISNASDNNSSGICSDAAYESGDERSHRTITAEEMEEQRRHAEGVDALLSFASSAASSPAKRPSSTPIEDEHFSSYAENIPHYISSTQNVSNGGPMRLITTTTDDGETILYHHRPSSSSSSSAYDTPPPNNYYNLPMTGSIVTSAAKKLKTSRNVRTKLKKKTTLIR